MGKKARDIMSTDVAFIGADTPVVEAAKKMRDLDVGALPICGDDKRLKGIITDRDITIHVVAEGKDPSSTNAIDVGEGDANTVTIGADDSIDEALATMQRHQVRRLPVIDGHEVVGIIAQADVATHLTVKETGQTVEAISR